MSGSMLSLLLLAACTAGGPTDVEPLPGPPPFASSEVPWNPFRSHPEQLPLTEDLRLAAASAAEVAGLEPAPWGPTPELAVVPPGRPVVPSLWYATFPPGDPQPVEGFDTVWRRTPWAELGEDGTLVVRWETRTPTPAGSVHVGVRLFEDVLGAPRYRRSAVEAAGAARHVHEAQFDIRRLLQPAVDVNGFADLGWGEVSWRVHAFFVERGATRQLDGRTAFRFDQEGRFVQQPTVRLGPSLNRLTPTSAVISFETDVPTTAAVAVSGLSRVVSDGAPEAGLPSPGTRHEVVVQGLAPGRVHVYQVAVSNGAETSVTPYNAFRTRAEGDRVRVAILSDSRAGHGSGDEAVEGVNAVVVRRLTTDAARRGAEAIFFPGDLIDGYVTQTDVYDLQLGSWLAAVEPVHQVVPVYTGMGNHEALVDAWSGRFEIDKAGADSAEARFAARMVNPPGAPPPEVESAPTYEDAVYAWDIGDVHFVMLNTNYWWASKPGDPFFEGRGNREGTLMDGQLAWLERDLAAAREAGARHIVVMGHEPAFPVGGHTQDAMWWNGEIPEVDAMRERFWRLLAANGVLAYVSGDEHNYSRALIGPETVSDAEAPVWSIITGGCGAPYYAQATPQAYAGRVEVFSAQQHYTLWTFEGDTARIEVYGITGELIDAADLTR